MLSAEPIADLIAQDHRDAPARASRRYIDVKFQPMPVLLTTPAPVITWHRGHSADREPIEVLILDAEYRQALAALRALARLGIAVGAVVCRSNERAALATRSRWCRMSAVVPNFSDDPGAYVDALLALIDAHPVQVILPSHDGSIEAIRSRRAEFERRTAVPLAQEPALEVAQSKPRTLELAAQLGIAVPRSILISDARDLVTAAADLGYPIVIKPVRTWAERDGVGTRLSSEVAINLDELQRRVSDIWDCGGIVMFQEWLPGRREAVSLFYAAEQIWARFVQSSYREFPVLGGASVLCQSIPPLPDLVEPAERLVRAMNLDGCSMVEFRRDARGRPVLMEVNARMPGSIALSHAAGIDFPKLIYDWALGRPLEKVAGYQIGRRLRWLGGDAWNLKCAFERDGHPDSPDPWGAVGTFLFDFVRRPSPLDIFDLSDMAPAFVDLRQMVMKPGLDKLRSLAFRDRGNVDSGAGSHKKSVRRQRRDER